MVLPSTSQSCGVCGETADSIHFGALSCRACAAFFRRKVAGNQKTVRRCAGACKLTNQILRRLCASCRFDKCIEIGMKTSAVLSRLPIKSENYSSPSTSNLERSLLEQLHEAYKKLIDARKTTFKLTDNHVPKLSNNIEMNEVVHIDFNLMLEVISPFFRDQMNEEHHKFLFPHFLVPFILFEWAFRSLPDKNGHLILPNDDYVDDEHLEKYYHDPDDKDEERAKQASIILKPYWKMMKKTLRTHLQQVKLELPEFLLLTALIYWDFGLQDQTDECIEICKRQRSKIFEELAEYEKSVRQNEDHCMRVGEILMVLHAVQKAFNICRESREISMIYNFYDKQCPIFELMEAREL